MTTFAAAPGLVFDDPELEGAIRKGLDAVEELLRSSTVSNYPFVTETAGHLVEAGGKRFRPLVVLLAAAAGGGDATCYAVVQAAVAIELTHLSTLYHDDVIDEAPLRRGAESVNRRWDNTIAILAGDFLFARASEITADLGSQATRILARTIAVLCEGEIRETLGPSEGEDEVVHHLGVLREKTGSLIGTSGHLGSLLSGAEPPAVQALLRYGDLVGVAFQLSDDLIDLLSESGQSGKTPGTDLREGVWTLPVLLARRAGLTGRLAELLAGPVAEADIPETLALLREHPSMAEARAVLSEWSSDARAALASLPDSAARRALESLADFVVSRTA